MQKAEHIGTDKYLTMIKYKTSVGRLLILTETALIKLKLMFFPILERKGQPIQRPVIYQLLSVTLWWLFYEFLK